MTRNRMIGLICAAAMLFSAGAFPQSAYAEETAVPVEEVLTYQDFTYKEIGDEDGRAIQITGYTGTARKVTIPNTIDGIRVISIAKETFQGNSEITSISLSNNLKTIPDGSFLGCTSLDSFYCPDSRKFSFSGGILYDRQPRSIYKRNLKSKTLEFKKTAVFCTKNSSYITVVDGTDQIADYAFANRTNLTHVIIPAGLKRIGKYAFYHCTRLTGMDMTAGGEQEASDCNIPYGTIMIDDRAFAFCDSIKRVNFPSTLQYIGEYAFLKTSDSLGIKNISYIDSVYIPDSVVYIGAWAFMFSTDIDPEEFMEMRRCNAYGNGDFVFFTDSETDEDGNPSAAVQYADKWNVTHISHQGGGMNDDGVYCITDANGNAIPIRTNVTHNPDNLFDHSFVYTATVPPTCTTPGAVSGICYCGYTFYQELAPLGHWYGTPQYAWNDDHTACTASVTCVHDSEHVISEEGTVTKRDIGGKTVYTAAFRNPMFGRDTVYEDGTELPPNGDVNDDGELAVTDVVQFQKKLHCGKDLTNWRAADLNEDGEIDVYDLALMKQQLLN